jgi:hypothetical protein
MGKAVMFMSRMGVRSKAVGYTKAQDVGGEESEICRGHDGGV